MNWQRMFLPLFVVCLAFCWAGNPVLAQKQDDRETLALDVGTGADLVLTSISGPINAFLNQTISITYDVQNQGDEASGAYQVGLYLSKDTTIDPANDRLLKEVAFPDGLTAGQSKTTTTKVTIPAGGVSGNYYLGGVLGSSSIASLEKVKIVRYEADSLNGTVTDHRTGLMWQQSDDGKQRTWSKAKTYCNRLALGGHDDWALPGIEALQTIVDYSRFHPAINPVFDCRKNDFYWSSSTYAGNPEDAWVVYFGDGLAQWSKKDNDGYVRCVRGEPW
jgi:hypothetical protein